MVTSSRIFVIEQAIVVPPDGGYGWFVTFSAFMCNFCTDGVAYTFGMFLNDLAEGLGVTHANVATTYSVFAGFCFLMGPLSCALINRFGFRSIGIIGGLVCSGSFLISSFMKSWPILTALIGIGGGFGYNMIYSAAIIVVGFYFEKWRALAMAVSVSGSSIGMFAFPPILTAIPWDWRWKFRIIALFLGTCSIFAISYRPIKPKDVASNEQSKSVITDEIETTKSCCNIKMCCRRFDNRTYPTIGVTESGPIKDKGQKSNKDSRSPNTMPGVQSYTNTYSRKFELDATESPSVYRLRSVAGQRRAARGCCKPLCKRKSRMDSETVINRPMYRDDIFYHGSMYNLKKTHRNTRRAGPSSRKPKANYYMSVTRAPTVNDLLQQHQCVCCPEAVLRTISSMIHFELLKSPAFVLLAFSGFFTLFGVYIPYTYIIPRAELLGITHNWSRLLLSFMGISNGLGRIASGVVSFYPVMDSLYISCITMFICGAITIASSFFTTQALQITFCVIFGFTIATCYSLRSVVIVNIFGMENLTNGFGLCLLFQGVASFLGLPLATMLYEKFGTYDAAFYFSGSSIFLSGVLLFPLRKIYKWEQERKRRVSFSI